MGCREPPTPFKKSSEFVGFEAQQQENFARSSKTAQGSQGRCCDCLHPKKHQSGKGKPNVVFHPLKRNFLSSKCRFGMFDFWWQVRNHLDVESARDPGEGGSSMRRNRWRHLFSPSTFLKIVRKKLNLHPFRWVWSKMNFQTFSSKDAAPSKTHPTPVCQEEAAVPIPH